MRHDKLGGEGRGVNPDFNVNLGLLTRFQEWNRYVSQQLSAYST
jgi:hypothetical protein